jgi:hypothetical protein
MRAAPAVQALLGPDRGWAAFTRASVALALAGIAAWAASGWGAQGWATALAAAPAAVLGWAIGGPLLGPAQGTLRWDGAAWSWQAKGAHEARAGAVAVMIDLGPWLLLRFAPPDAGAVWLPVAEGTCGPAWRALRVALHARGAPE